MAKPKRSAITTSTPDGPTVGRNPAHARLRAAAKRRGVQPIEAAAIKVIRGRHAELSRGAARRLIASRTAAGKSVGGIKRMLVTTRDAAGKTTTRQAGEKSGYTIPTPGRRPLKGAKRKLA